ncbi:polyhydroxyalkanoate synthesis repressor PhaR [Oceanibacterium hippocampi]|uniref:PHB/PHA accumulation regulator DNA-binding domain protein n=1 Tax=Oceanibacterium hippocampi TaxID=745714 RepID=A0A1Y5RWC6_9PROT|nr:polyhydroxyalkanoate synthesis repressor PhaR [Oceanibacterium hippocampi]SLN25993.1 PHB/PHA accumulation regulator DNA-binding domain protein [Oceanibacterium hippocampi]
MKQENGKQTDTIVIKKYANRRLYNTDTSSYVTLDHLAKMVKEGKEFVVFDAKSGDEITRSVLTQIIFEEESKGQNMLPVPFLRELISYYGDSLQGLVPGYLEMSMSTFSRNQEQMRTAVAETFGELNPFRTFEEIGRQNLAMFQEAMKLFSPVAPGNSTPGTKGDRPEGAAPAKGGESKEALDELKQQLAVMQAQIDKLSGNK